MKRRILSSLMALVLVFGLLPVSAMAASVDATIVPLTQIISASPSKNGKAQ